MCELRVNLQISPENTTDENPEVLFVVFDLFLVCVCVCVSEMHFLIHLENSLSLEWFVVWPIYLKTLSQFIRHSRANCQTTPSSSG